MLHGISLLGRSTVVDAPLDLPLPSSHSLSIIIGEFKPKMQLTTLPIVPRMFPGKDGLSLNEPVYRDYSDGSWESPGPLPRIHSLRMVRHKSSSLPPITVGGIRQQWLGSISQIQLAHIYWAEIPAISTVVREMYVLDDLDIMYALFRDNSCDVTDDSRSNSNLVMYSV